MVRYRATVAYDGTAYFGFQRQAAGVPTIQLRLEEALGRITGQGRRGGVVGAGRTDTGVHASGQVIAFGLDWTHGADDLRRALNANLPPDIVVREVAETGAGFHPRYDALSRTYVYRLVIAPVRDPLRRLYAWHREGELDIPAMQAAAGSLIGAHDFSAFGTPPQGENPVRTVYEATWWAGGDEAAFTIRANAFLYRMVRRIVGTLVQVGEGRMTPARFQDILTGRDPAQSAAPAPPWGLTLVAVEYQDEIPDAAAGGHRVERGEC
ncbi:MAG: tRNA pseudouridine(38-40) synthase TruA [Anaerolineae bacterium]